MMLHTNSKALGCVAQKDRFLKVSYRKSIFSLCDLDMHGTKSI